MKLKIPRVLHFGALRFGVVYDEVLLVKLNERGHAGNNPEKIIIPEGRSVRQTFQVLVHEMLHVASGESGAALNEEQVVGVSALLAHALLAMGIEPDFSDIPQEHPVQQTKDE